MVAVKQNGLALRSAHEKLRADREVVIAALRQDGSSSQKQIPTTSIPAARLLFFPFCVLRCFLPRGEVLKSGDGDNFLCS